MESALRQRYGFSNLLGQAEDGANEPDVTDGSSTCGSSGGDPKKVTELILDGCKIKSIDAEGAACLACFENLEVLTLNQTGLAAISDFPVLSKLQILELQDNGLGGTSSLEHLANKLPSLEDLSLAGNRLKSVQDLACLGELPNLRRLELELNPFTHDPLYRKGVFGMFPKLQVVDHVNMKGEDVDEDEEDEDEDEAYEEKDGDLSEAETTKRESALKTFYEAGMDGLENDEGEDFEPSEEDEEDEEEEEDDDDVEEDEDGEEEEKAAGDQQEDVSSVLTKRHLGSDEMQDENTAAKRRRQS